MAKIIGREKEMQTLAESMKSERSEFVAVYGRRRIGKTFLIKEYFNNKFSFLFVGTRDIGRAAQLDNFALALQRQFAIDCKPALQNWFEAFHLLEDLLAKKRAKGKRVVFIDEMPWMDSAKSDFVSALEQFWNGWANMRDDIVLIACGSATSWIVDKVFHNRGGLFNRVTRHLYLKPFTLNEVEKLLQSQGIRWDRYQIAQCYMTLGGVPFYLTLLNRSESLSQNIDRLFFSSGNAPLRMEYSELYSALFKEPEKYMTIVKALSAKRDGMTRNELMEQCGFGGSSLTKVLSDLERCDFIFGYSQYGNKIKNTLYRIKDFYTLFYYKFVENDDGRDNSRWSHIQQSQQVRIWQGFSFELLCLLHLDQMKYKLHIDVISNYSSSWRSSDPDNPAQIDLVIERGDRIINLCEMKFSSSPYTIDKDYEMRLRERMGLFVSQTRTRCGIHITLVTTFGVVRNSHYHSIVNSEVCLDDLFA